MNDPGQLSNTDHDLLVRLDTKVDGFISSQVDHETRLRVVEKLTEQGIGSHKGSATTWNWISTSLLVLAAVVEPVVILYVAFRGH